jgi:acyl carrier protein
MSDRPVGRYADERDPSRIGDQVIALVSELLGIEDRAADFTASTPLFGSLPELDSMAIVELVAALETEFGITIDDHEITGAVFETMGSLAAFVHAKLADHPTASA